MDPASRRACWELLRKKRAGRVTLLTTHFMDEAELLADRIAVMKEGKLQCCGSGLFLKNRFGLGYNLTVVLDSATSNDSAAVSDDAEKLETGLANPHFGSVVPDKAAVAQDILRFLSDQIPNTLLVRRSARELTFRFPQGTEESFPDLFDALESRREALGIGAYGVANTTLEEVSLQLAEEEKTPTVSDSPASEEHSTEIDDSSGDDSSGDDASNAVLQNEEEERILFDDLQHLGPLRQVALLYQKRFLVQKRDLKGAFFMIVLPVLLCALVLLVLTIDVPLAGPPISMSMDLYEVDPSGGIAPTDVVVAGGASLNVNSTETVETMFESMSTLLKEDYPESVFIHEHSASSSHELSQYLLDTYNDKDHNLRYGAYVFDDLIGMETTVAWTDLKNDLTNLTAAIGVVNLTSPLAAIADQVEFNLSISSVEEFLYNYTSLTNESKVNAVRLIAWFGRFANSSLCPWTDNVAGCHA